MRLWSLHPRHLDRIGLVAWWREALLAQAVLAGKTRGYQHHPQLNRFREVDQSSVARDVESKASLVTMGAYLAAIADEADVRGYRFDRKKILIAPTPGAPGKPAQSDQLTVTAGQIEFERNHLMKKLAARSPGDAERFAQAQTMPHPLLQVVPGEIEDWERP